MIVSRGERNHCTHGCDSSGEFDDRHQSQDADPHVLDRTGQGRVPGAFRAERPEGGGLLSAARAFGYHVFAVAPPRAKRRGSLGRERAAFRPSVPERAGAGRAHVAEDGSARRPRARIRRSETKIPENWVANHDSRNTLLKE